MGSSVTLTTLFLSVSRFPPVILSSISRLSRSQSSSTRTVISRRRMSSDTSTGDAKIPVRLIACGSFNPVTNAHFRMFERAKEFLERQCPVNYGVEKGIISPVNDAYGEKKNLVSAKLRCEMARLGLQDVQEELPWVTVDEWEANQKDWTRTVQSLRHHQELMDREFVGQGPRPQLKLLCGADLLETFAKPGLWHEDDIREIVGTFGLVVITRMNSDPYSFINQHDVLYENSKNILVVREETGGSDVSATRIRNALRRGSGVTFFLQRSVIKFIADNKLYKD